MVFEDIRSLLAQQLEIDEKQISMDSNLVEDLGADSFDVSELMIIIEQKFGIEIPEDKILELHIVGNIVDYIEKSI